MAISTSMTSSFKTQLMAGLHNFSNPGGHTFKVALYNSDAVLGASTTAYTAVNEVTGTGYTAGGATLTSISPVTSGTVGYVSFADVTWSASTITANGALIYNANSSNASVITLSFGSDKTVNGGDFQIIFPTANATSAIIRIT